MAEGYEGWNGIRPDLSALDAESIVLEDVIIKDIEISKRSMTIASIGGGDTGSGGTPVRRLVTKTQSSHPDLQKPTDDESKQDVIITWESGLLQTIQDLTAPPCRWFEIDGEGCKLSIAGNRLIVRQSRKGHEQVVAVLEQLELAADDAAGEQKQQE